MPFSGCAANTAEEMLAALIATDYEAVFLTEHNHVWSADDLTDLQAAFPQIRVFGGVELADSTAAQHLLVLGTTDATYIDLARAGRWEDTLIMAQAEGLVTILAHPCRFQGGHELLHAGLRPDAIEHRTPNHDDAMSLSACAIADYRELPMVNSGDLHTLGMVDCFWIETERPLQQAADIRPVILDRTYRNCTHAS